MQPFDLTDDQIRVLRFVQYDMERRYSEHFKTGSILIPVKCSPTLTVFGFVCPGMLGYFKTPFNIDEDSCGIPIENACAWVNWHIHGMTPADTSKVFQVIASGSDAYMCLLNCLAG